MNQKTKTLVGVGVVAVAAYLIWQSQSKKTVGFADPRPPRLIRPKRSGGDTVFLPTAPTNPRPRPRPRPQEG